MCHYQQFPKPRGVSCPSVVWENPAHNSKAAVRFTVTPFTAETVCEGSSWPETGTCIWVKHTMNEESDQTRVKANSTKSLDTWISYCRKKLPTIAVHRVLWKEWTPMETMPTYLPMEYPYSKSSQEPRASRSRRVSDANPHVQDHSILTTWQH